MSLRRLETRRLRRTTAITQDFRVSFPQESDGEKIVPRRGAPMLPTKPKGHRLGRVPDQTRVVPLDRGFMSTAASADP
jgi:hypothetical protein